MWRRICCNVVIGLVAYSSLVSAGESFFKGTLSLPSGGIDSVRVLVKTIKEKDGFEYGYGLIVRPKSKKGAFYRIEGLQDRKQKWIRIFQDDNRVLSSTPDFKPTYTGSMNKSGVIQLGPTAFGKKQKCLGTIHGECVGCQNWYPFAKENYWGYEFLDSGNGGTKSHHSGLKQKNRPTELHFSAHLRLGQEVVSGTFPLKELFPGLAILRRDAEEEQNRKIVALASYLERSGFLGADDHIYVLQTKPGDQPIGCWEALAKLVED